MDGLSIRTFTCNCWVKTSYEDTIRCKQSPGQKVIRSVSADFGSYQLRRTFVNRIPVFRVRYTKESKTVAAGFKEVIAPNLKSYLKLSATNSAIK
jgi:hypothetical protein